MADKTGGETPRWREPAAPAADEAVVRPRRQIKTGPLHVHEDLEDRPGLESRLPLLILLGLGLLIAVQMFLAI